MRIALGTEVDHARKASKNTSQGGTHGCGQKHNSDTASHKTSKTPLHTHNQPLTTKNSVSRVSRKHQQKLPALTVEWYTTFFLQDMLSCAHTLASFPAPHTVFAFHQQLLNLSSCVLGFHSMRILSFQFLFPTMSCHTPCQSE